MPERKRKEPVQEKNLLFMEEQVVLARERTASSFMRTGLGFVGVGIVLMNAFPGDPASLIFGWMLVGIGITLLIQYAFRLSKYGQRIKRLDKKIDKE
jgi:uncharacterized membrane protein YidH (DUF202 family)